MTENRIIDEIAAERRRQIEVEGWTLEHDDQHDLGEMSRAAACYALEATNGGRSPTLSLSAVPPPLTAGDEL